MTFLIIALYKYSHFFLLTYVHANNDSVTKVHSFLTLLHHK